MSDKNASKFDVTKLHFTEFKIIKGRLDSPFEFEKEHIISFNTDLSYEFGFNQSDKLVKVDFGVSVITQSKTMTIQEASGSFSFTYIFLVDNFNELTILDENQNFKIDGDLANAIVSITYSTARGILIARFQGTALENFILPVISPSELMKKI
jgi:hypothetical protein